MDAETFQQFIRHVSTIVAEDAAFIFDNASAHRRSNERSQEILNGAQIIRMLPSYSLMLNIVENAIICLKAAPKRALEEARPHLLAATHDERTVTLTGLVEGNMDAIQPHMAPAWLRKSQSYILACLQSEDIFM